MVDRVFSMISLSAKAGKVVGGEFSVETAVKNRKALLVIIANDASDNTKKKFSDKCKYYNVPVRMYGSREELGLYTGKGFRAVLAICDENFAKSISEKIDKLDGGCL